MDKIVFVIGAVKSGGAEKRAILISNLLKDKYITKVFAFHGEKTNQIDYVYSPSYEKYKQTSKHRRIVALRDYLKKEKPDFVFSFVPHVNFMTTIAMKSRELKTTKHIVSMVFHNFKFKNNLLLRYSLLHADAVFYQTNGQKKFVPCNKYSFIISNPIKVDQRCDLDFRALKFMSVGRLEEQKNFIFQIRSFKFIHDSFTNATLDIYGSGSLKLLLLEEIKRLGLEDCVIIHDYVDNISVFYKAHNLFLFTSLYEGFPNALAEAMSYGMVCFCTYFETGCSELIIDKETGFLDNSKKPELFAKMVVNVVNNNKNLLIVGDNARKHVNDICNFERFRTKMIEELDIIKHGNVSR